MKSKGMRIAGGVLALVASVGGTIAGIVTVFFGAAANFKGNGMLCDGTLVGDYRN
jgi:hypothetical protein